MGAWIKCSELLPPRYQSVWVVLVGTGQIDMCKRTLFNKWKPKDFYKRKMDIHPDDRWMCTFHNRY